MGIRINLVNGAIDLPPPSTDGFMRSVLRRAIRSLSDTWPVLYLPRCLEPIISRRNVERTLELWLSEGATREGDGLWQYQDPWNRIAAANRILDCYDRRSTILDLSGLDLTSLPSSAIEALPWLETLNLTHNLFIDLPERIFTLSNPCEISLFDCPLSPAFLANLRARTTDAGYRGPRFRGAGEVLEAVDTDFRRFDLSRIEGEFNKGNAAVISFTKRGVLALIVDPIRLNENPLEVLQALNDFRELEARLRVRFWREGRIQAGMDAGGLRQELITLLFSALSPRGDDDDRTLFPLVEHDKLYLPKICGSPEDQNEQQKAYETIAWIYANALNGDAIKTGKLFDPAFFHMLSEITLGDLSEPNLSPEARKRLLNVYLRETQKALFPDPPDEAIDAFISNGTLTEQMQTTWDPDTTKEDVMQAIQFDEVFKAICVIARSLARRVNWEDTIQNQQYLDDLLQGSVTKEILITAIQNSGADRKKQKFLIRYITGLSSDEELGNLCFAATGSRVKIPKISSQNTGPGFHTCFNTIDLPNIDWDLPDDPNEALRDPLLSQYNSLAALLTAQIGLALGGYSQA